VVSGSGTNGLPWTNPANAEGAVDGISANNNASAPNGTWSDYLASNDTVVSIPSGSTITDIEVSFYTRDPTGTTEVADWNASLADGTHTWTYTGSGGSALPASYTTFSVGGAAGTGGLPASMITASGTLTIQGSFAVQAIGGSGYNADVDSVSWSITYTPPGGAQQCIVIGQAVNRASRF